MKVLHAKDLFFDYQRMNAKKNTMRNYQLLFSRFCNQFGDRDLESLTVDEILSFLK